MHVYLFLINALALTLMLLDKHFARTHRRRIPERTLIATAALGGSLGGLLGMYLFRHKTRHWYFVAGFWALLAVHIALTVFLFYTGALRLP